MKVFANRSVNTTFNIITSLLLIALFLALAFNSYRREQGLILMGAVNNARAISHQIIQTRDYLARSVTTEPEHNYRLVPQVVATSIARELTSGSPYYVRQISLRYRNPENRPDQFETEKLKYFRDVKAEETWEVADEKGKKSLRYFLPMKADRYCLTCHGTYDTAPKFVQQRFPRGHFSYGYKVGEVIGAVSVSVPMEELYTRIGTNFRRDLIYDGIVLVLFILVTGSLIRKSILVPIKNVASNISEVARTGNFATRLEKSGTNEISELIGSFNELMSELDRKTLQRMESEERYRNFIEIAQSPIITFMADGKIVIANQKAETLFALTKQELLGQSIFDFMENGEELQNGVEDYFSVGSSKLIGTTTLQKVRDVYGNIIEVEMVISVSQSDQNQMFSAILRRVK